MRRRKAVTRKSVLERLRSEKKDKGRVDLYVSLTLWEDFKEACDKEGTSASAVFNAFMADFLER